MTVTVPVIGIVILIFVLHTIATHLINWMFRETAEEQTGTMLFLAIMLNIVEVMICTSLLISYVG
jgi:hypothetical protein